MYLFSWLEGAIWVTKDESVEEDYILGLVAG